jgi:three-Cys-motif partner protein
MKSLGLADHSQRTDSSQGCDRLKMPNLQARSTQTKVKHLILQSYLIRWGSIIVYGLKKSYERVSSAGGLFQARFVYIDGFAFQGRYASETVNGLPMYGSPIIGIQALDEIESLARTETGFEPEVTTVLIEQERSYYDELLQSLESAGLGPRVQQTTDFSTLRDGQISTICGNFLDHADQLRDFTDVQYTYSFYLLDPYGPSGIPLNVVAPIIRQEHADVMINFPYQDLHKKTGSAARESRVHERHLQYYDAVYGGGNWRDVAKEFESDVADMESRLVDLYLETLQAQDNDLAIKLVPLLFPDKERTMFYLILTTHDPTGALAVNEILDDAKLQEHDLRIQWKNEKFRVRSGGFIQPPLFSTAEPVIPQRPSREEIAEHIYKLCRGERIEYREVLKRIVNEPYYHTEIRGAMALLKRQKRIDYVRLRNPELISFKD